MTVDTKEIDNLISIAEKSLVIYAKYPDAKAKINSAIKMSKDAAASNDLEKIKKQYEELKRVLFQCGCSLYENKPENPCANGHFKTQSTQPVFSSEETKNDSTFDRALKGFLQEQGIETSIDKDGKNVFRNYHCPVFKESVLSLDIVAAEQLSDTSISMLESGELHFWNLTISGYETDERELYEIPEVRAWCKKVYSEMPYLPILLSDAAMGWFLFCLLDIVNVERKRRAMTIIEKEAIQAGIEEIKKNDPVTAENMKETLEYFALIHVKSADSAISLMENIHYSSYNFLINTGANLDIIELMNNSDVRLSGVLRSAVYIDKPFAWITYNIKKGKTNPSAEKRTLVDSGDEFVNNCFNIDYDQINDDRKWYDMPNCKAIAEAGNSGRIEEAFHLATSLRAEYPDFWFPYYWFAILYRKTHSYDKAIEVLVEGLRVSKHKFSLLSMIGTTFWDKGMLPEAVMWWIRSIVTQLRADDLGNSEPFFHLSYVAEGLELWTARLRLRRIVDIMNKSKPRLNSQCARQILDASRLQEPERLKKSIVLLEKSYIAKLKRVTPDVEAFMNDLSTCSSAEGLIPIVEFPMLYNQIVVYLRRSLNGIQIQDAFARSFFGRCPRCGKETNGGILYALGIIDFSHDKIAAEYAASTPTAQRFKKGLCPNGKCISHEIVVLWNL